MTQEIAALMRRMVALRSDTGTALETDVSQFMLDYFREAGFPGNAFSCGTVRVPGDIHNREVVWALLRGRGDNCVVLLNHHDVVNAEDYGDLIHVAYDPPRLKGALRKRDDIPQDVLEDLTSEEWCFGRGTADMKAGAAIQMTLMHRFAEDMDKLDGSLLFLSVPDEENLSAGMRAAVPLMSDFKKRHGLRYRLLINAEPTPREGGSPVYYDGSVGKLMVVVYVQGRKTHVGAALEGVNPAAVLARLVERTDASVEFCDRVRGEISPPPTWMQMRDFKHRYDASLPEAAGGYLSILSLESDPQTLVKRILSESSRAMEDTKVHLRAQHQKLGLQPPNEGNWPVLSFSELMDRARRADAERADGVLKAHYNRIERELAEGRTHLPESHYALIQSMLECAGILGPAVVAALSPPYYPVFDSEKIPDGHAVTAAAAAFLTDRGFVRKPFFMGISDLSYAGSVGSALNAHALAADFPLWGDRFYQIPLKEMADIGMPAIILGPWGKDLHRWSERVYLPDVERTLPEVTEALIRSVFDLNE